MSKKTTTEYTRLAVGDVLEILDRARESFSPFVAVADFVNNSKVEECEDAQGAYFIDFAAKTWREAAAFQAAVIGAAWAAGHFAEVCVEWDDEIVDGRRRTISVFVAAADYMTDDGRAAVNK